MNHPTHHIERPDHLDALPSPTSAYVIAIVGGTCSGKTSVVDILCKKFPNHVMKIPQDCFYKPGDANTNFDHPDSLELDLAKKLLEEAKAGNDIDIPVYDFTTHSRKSEVLHLKAKPIIIVEGILVMTHPGLSELCDLKIYIHAELDTMYRRRLVRDEKERGRKQEDIDIQWDRFVKPMHLRYVLPSKDRSHIVINNDQHQILEHPDSIPQINIIITYIDSYLDQLSENCTSSESCTQSDSEDFERYFPANPIPEQE